LITLVRVVNKTGR